MARPLLPRHAAARAAFQRAFQRASKRAFQRASKRAFKRAFDLAAAALGLVALSPVFAVVAVAVRRDGGPAFFRHDRVGRGGRTFRMWKFRTMVSGAEHRGPALTVAGDARVTRVGAWLRRTKLDELPQLLNVLAGDMSVVGPRPEVPRYVALYTHEQRRVLDLLPGITDPASVRYRDEEHELAAAADPERFYVTHVMPEKIRLNLAHGREAGLLRDLAVIVRTLRALAGPAAGR